MNPEIGSKTNMPVYREVFQGIDPIAWYTVWCKWRESKNELAN